MKYNNNFDALYIMGPTASGKSSLSFSLAQALGGEIINTDSCQLYESLPLLSAQPTSECQAMLPHHLYGILSPAEKTNAASWLTMAAKCHIEIQSRKKIPIYVGGTGLYFKVLHEGIAEFPSISSATQKEVKRRLDLEGSHAVHKWLLAKDPKIEARVHPNDGQRIGRALGLYLETGQAMEASLAGDMKMSGHVKRPYIVTLMPSKEDLQNPIISRIQTMLAGEGQREVASLIASQSSVAPTLAKTIGFDLISEHLQGNISLSEVENRMAIATRQYAKRQRTWLRHQVKPTLVVNRVLSHLF